MRYRPIEERFWDKVDKSGECWVWTGACGANGYGVIWFVPEPSVHRLSWELANGPIPDGMWVCHHCDNRLCVRPDHLFLGTPADNTRDMFAKHRNAAGASHPLRVHPERAARGRSNGQARLTPEQVVLIREWAAAGVPQREIARRCGVVQGTISHVLAGRTWGHVHGY